MNHQGRQQAFSKPVNLHFFPCFSTYALIKYYLLKIPFAELPRSNAEFNKPFFLKIYSLTNLLTFLFIESEKNSQV